MGFGESAGGRTGSDSSWRFTGLEFEVLWRQLGRDRLPYPLRFRPTADDRDDLDRQRRAAAQYWAPRVTETLHHHLTVLAEPDIRLEVAGFAGAGLAARIRMHAGIRGTGATLAIQLPGADADTGGDVLIHGVPPMQIPHAVAAALPAVPAGSRSALRFRRSDLDSAGGPLLVSAGATRLRDEALGLLRRPRTGIGEITAFAGVAYDGRPTADGIGLHWLDFDGDGRYTMRETGAVVVAPAATVDLAGEIQRLVEAIRTRVPVR
ncbi:ESX secretion-associated protein EspG [Rhodococcus sp. AG1013]|uniref:ESX secretion-associated protein EspG n=1 Tax=unclassified Rhodococcus (in: high G+C Gram-positive bacteria) TaxID=192944 RepID=UPI000E0AB6C4|nr:ESX secretion-associated protein EspG [Rhodococcus sp. AG1013]RDI33750.1 ESAT-6 protein secretion system EspG family protein [Rhodococcus sp. AG1013]